MYQSHVSLEIRILISVDTRAFNKNNDTWTVCADESVYLFCHALRCKCATRCVIEREQGGQFAAEETGTTGISVCIASEGFLPIEYHGRKKKIIIEEVRLEEFRGRLIRSAENTYMDYTYAGCPCICIKTNDSLEVGDEAALFLESLNRLVSYFSAVPDIPDEQRFCCNAYVALANYPHIPSYLVKLRHINSPYFARRAINAELTRQENKLLSGKTIVSETRIWNERQNLTQSFNAEPVCFPTVFVAMQPPLVFEPDRKLLCRDNFPVELPGERIERFCRVFGLAPLRAEQLCTDKHKADFFEQSVVLGVEPMLAAHWLTSDMSFLFQNSWRKNGLRTLTPLDFAFVMKKLSVGNINSSIAKNVLLESLETGTAPETIIKNKELSLISKEADLLPVIHKVLSACPEESEKLRCGEMHLLEYLTGCVMKETASRAAPLKVKDLIKQELQIQVIYVLSMGGVISAVRRSDGSIEADSGQVLRKLCSGLSASARIQVVPIRSMLSEEIAPDDWAALIAEISMRIASGVANGIVITHGSDTLVYTAALLFWLFSDAGVPIVITGASSLPADSDEGKRSLEAAVSIAAKEKNGVYVIYGGRVFSPLNLKFVRHTEDGFMNWNLMEPVFTGSGPIAQQFTSLTEPDSFVIERVLREATDRLCILKIYPGFKPSQYFDLLQRNRAFVVEMYESGTGNMGAGDYSLKPLFLRGNKEGCHFYCTSQQECITDFSRYTTSLRVWRHGVVPMGRLTTEAAVTLYYAASLLCDTQEELDRTMELYSELYR